MIDNKIAELMELESYKKALIYEYVTGKKKPRGDSFGREQRNSF